MPLTVENTYWYWQWVNIKSNNNITTSTSDAESGSINDIDENISNTPGKPSNIDNEEDWRAPNS